MTDNRTPTAPAGLPVHVAVIMDGNGRWATARGQKRSEGHRAGVEAARRIVTRCRELGIPHLTLYTFSKENWARPKDEVVFLFELLASFLTKELPTLMERDIRLVILGESGAIPMPARQVVEMAVKTTAANRSMTLNLALNYSGRDEILRACRALVAAGASPDEVTEERFSAELYTRGQPDPDLVIRTSGEVRVSNFLLFQASYAEFYFTSTLWPDFMPDELEAAFAEYATRQRRYGKAEAGD